MFLQGCSDHQDQLFCLFEIKKKAFLGLLIGRSLKRFFQWELIACRKRGQKTFCGCSRFRFVATVIFSSAVLIKLVF